jgi:hypothetical protein
MYKNWKGVTRARRLSPLAIWWGHTECHPEDQWLVKCIDREDSKVKDFALLDFLGPVPAGATSAGDKPKLKGLFRDNLSTPEGKYLVKRRDGTVVEWPNFVLGARDPVAQVALRAYGLEVLRLCAEEPATADALGLTPEFGWSVVRHAEEEWPEYRRIHGVGDPGRGRHRKDDPATVAEMRRGHSA